MKPVRGCGSFTAAAQLLAKPKTTVSRRVAALAREVGVRLLQRTTRSLSMTDAGRLYCLRSSEALRTIEEANLRLAETRAEPWGTIRISAPVGFAGHFPTQPPSFASGQDLHRSGKGPDFQAGKHRLKHLLSAQLLSARSE